MLISRLIECADVNWLTFWILWSSYSAVYEIRQDSLLKFLYSEKATIFLWNLHRRFFLSSNGQIYGGDFAKFCGILRIYEFYRHLNGNFLVRISYLKNILTGVRSYISSTFISCTPILIWSFYVVCNMVNFNPRIT